MHTSQGKRGWSSELLLLLVPSPQPSSSQYTTAVKPVPEHSPHCHFAIRAPNEMHSHGVSLLSVGQTG